MQSFANIDANDKTRLLYSIKNLIYHCIIRSFIRDPYIINKDPSWLKDKSKRLTEVEAYKNYV